MRRLLLCMCFLLPIVACNARGSDHGRGDAGITKDQARKLGKGDWSRDYCEWLGWYGDGICDDFCPQPDPDCYDPCADKSCGDRCRVCPPDSSECAETAVQKYCQPDGTCSATEPECSGGDGTCENSCHWADDGVCDDGGPGSAYAVCPFGTDCADCGPRERGGGEDDETCVVGGCSSHLCYDPDEGSGASTCEWRPEYACYDHAICERQPGGDCGWTETDEYRSCLDEVDGGEDDAREPVTGGCARRNGSCTTDADCVTGGCGDELCYNPAEGWGISTCDCTAPTDVAGCGCVEGQCTWYN